MIAYASGLCEKNKGDPKYSICDAYPSFNDNYGVLSGPAFSLSFATIGIFGGLIADSVNRKFLILAACALWSAMTFLSGFIDSFIALYICRFGLGIFQSIFNPTSYSMISDIFHQDYRTTANAVFNVGIYFGGGLASAS